jgi:hypothetical protein
MRVRPIGSCPNQPWIERLKGTCHGLVFRRETQFDSFTILARPTSSSKSFAPVGMVVSERDRYAGPVTVPGVVQEIPRPHKLGIIACNWTDPYLLETNEHVDDRCILGTV